MPPIAPSSKRLLPPKSDGASPQGPFHQPSGSQSQKRFQTPAFAPPASASHLQNLSYSASPARPQSTFSQFQASSTRSGGVQLPFLLPPRTRQQRDLVDDVVSSSPPPHECIPESDIGQDSDDDSRPGNLLNDDVDENSQDIQLPVCKKRRISISFSSDAGDIQLHDAAAGDDVIDDHMPSSLPHGHRYRTTSYQAGSSPPPLPDLGSSSMLERYVYSATAALPSSQASHNHITTIEQFQQPPMPQPTTIRQFQQQPTITQFQHSATQPTPSLQQPTFQRAPRFRQATQSTEAEVLQLVFSSPQKKKKTKHAPKYTPGGLAASMQGWLAHVRSLAGMEESVRVISVRREQRMAMAVVARSELIDGQPVGEDTVRMVLAGIGTAKDDERGAGFLVPGCTVVVTPPTWWVRLEGEEWLVACDWRVAGDTVTDEQDSGSEKNGEPFIESCQ